MLKIARQHATYVETMAGFEGRYENLDGYTIGFEAGTLEVIALGGAPSEGPVYEPDGIAEDITYCTGICDGPAIAQHAAEAPMVWR